MIEKNQMFVCENGFVSKAKALNAVTKILDIKNGLELGESGINNLGTLDLNLIEERLAFSNFVNAINFQKQENLSQVIDKFFYIVNSSNRQYFIIDLSGSCQIIEPNDVFVFNEGFIFKAISNNFKTLELDESLERKNIEELIKMFSKAGRKLNYTDVKIELYTGAIKQTELKTAYCSDFYFGTFPVVYPYEAIKELNLFNS